MRKTFVTLVVGLLGVFAGSREARAEVPVGLEIASKAGYAPFPRSMDENPFGLGVGARAGVVLDGFYAGANIVDYLGTTRFSGYSEHTLLLGVELGQGFEIAEGRFTFRPQIGIGEFVYSTAEGTDVFGNYEGGTNAANSLYLEPGVTTLVHFGTAFVGLDANVLLLPGHPYFFPTLATGTFHAQVGMRF